MNWDQVEGNWKQFKGKVKEQWGKLTDDELDIIAGRRDQLAGKIQEQYGITKEEAEEQIASWERRQRASPGDIPPLPSRTWKGVGGSRSRPLIADSESQEREHDQQKQLAWLPVQHDQ